jgi:hypothetical protein
MTDGAGHAGWDAGSVDFSPWAGRCFLVQVAKLQFHMQFGLHLLAVSAFFVVWVLLVAGF